MKVLVFVDSTNGTLKNSSLELLSCAAAANAIVSAVSLGTSCPSAADLATWGVTKLYSGEAAPLDKPNPLAYLEALSKVVEKEAPDVILASSNTLTRDVFSRLTVRLDAAFASDVTQLQLSPLVVKRPIYSGKCLASVEFVGTGTKILLVRPNQLPIVAANKSATCEKISIDAATPSAQLVSIEKSSSAALDLTEANVIVSGGRGLKEAENFKIVYALAEPIGATVGASR
ncbi:electron transfer flavoprotein subunit alpha/FixB family protein, partial [bacterium]|nr:electron transfer flavoprotein subunit alpha/FixB family protein [bacterium]